MENWVKRTVVGKDRLQELVDLYQELGFKVKVEVYKNAVIASEECDACFENTTQEYYIIYTKK
jgi:hypothetical protein